MTTSATESPEACALQLRKLLKMGPHEGDHGAADLAATIVTQLTARVPFGAQEEIDAKKLIADLRGFFLSPGLLATKRSYRSATTSADGLNYSIKPSCNTAKNCRTGGRPASLPAKRTELG
jgi:hypothetical protein